MSIQFVDPGYGKNWVVVGDTGTISCVESEEYNPINGVAFTGLKSQGAEFCAVSNISTVIYSTGGPFSRSTYQCMFSVYLDLGTSEYFCAGFNSDYNSTEKTHYIKFDADGYTVVTTNLDGTTNETRSDVSTQGLHTVEMLVYCDYASTSSSTYRRGWCYRFTVQCDVRSYQPQQILFFTFLH